ncbi:hybrid sensor histidine kinase/response regulator [Tautonia plasticadhaerens]|uniref:histidine kinase n=1 Tax=Tautonia plasticadhaerens TaxID=2527974 RepID=A0A518H3B0_9BACT|nr:CHASE3 domain-containing protein [Tautonia plasticadhaerens]QDV35323.1 Autoinducer 2 sensor kinase/phosphatase LuxQ [Tautonia plasticadhaerens]
MKDTRTILALGFAATAGVLALNAAVAVANLRQIAANNRRVVQGVETLRQLNETLSSAKDAETGQRGYILTGEEPYLEPYRAGVAAIDGHLRVLRASLGNPGQGERLAALESLLGQRLAVLDRTVRLRREEGFEPAAEVVRAGRGKSLMDDIRLVVAEMEEHERRLLTRRSAEARASLGRAIVALAVATAAALTLVTLLYVALRRHLAARERSEASLREQAERWQVTLASIGDGVIVCDDRGRVTLMNPVAESLCGQTASEASGRPLEEVFRIINEETRQPAEAPVARVLREGVVVGLANHTALVAADGTERPIHDGAAPIRDARGQITGVVLIFQDDTERRRHERELVEANRRKDEFIAMLSHELRNPLAAIGSAVVLIRDPAAASEHGWAGEVIERQVRHMTRLVDDLLDVARLTRGAVRLRTEPLDALTVIGHVVEAIRPLLDERGIRLEIGLMPDLLPLEADPVRLLQVVDNLLSNAARFTEPGGHIRLSAEHAGDRVVLRVRDTGVGIPAELLPRVFEPFVQGERSSARTEGGLGVGLAIARSLVELHGGTITARSDGPGRGSEFVVSLPAAEPQAIPDRRSTPAEPAKRRPPRVLIVDDNKDLVRGLSLLLRRLGYQVAVAYDGPEGIDAARSEHPEVILLDIGLPTLDGYEVARRLRREAALEGTRIIAVTGYGQEEDRRRSAEAGFDLHLTKPVDPETLVSLMGKPG